MLAHRFHQLQSLVAAAAGRGHAALRRLVFIAAVVLACGGGLATAAGLDPDPAPETYAGGFALFIDDTYAGPAHAFSGCTTDVDRAGMVTHTPCRVDVGLAMGSVLTDHIQAAMRNDGTAPARRFAISKVVNGVVVSEVAFHGWVAGVKLPSVRSGVTPAPAWLRLDLDVRRGTLQRFVGAPKQPLPRKLPAYPYPDVAIESTRLTTTVTSLDPAGVRAIDPIRFAYAGDASGNGLMTSNPVTMRLADGTLSSANASSWLDARVKAAAALRTFGVVYSDASGKHRLDMQMAVNVAAFDPFARTDGERHLRMETPQPTTKVTVNWAGAH
jgi:hypothetical protein